MTADATFESLHAAAALAQGGSDYRALERYGRELVALGERTGEKHALAWGRHFIGVARLRVNDGDGAKRELLAAAELFNELGDRINASRAMMNLAMIELAINVDVAAARSFYDAAESIVRESGDPLRIARSLGNLGEIYRLEGDYRAAMTAATESLEMFRLLGDHARSAWQLTNIAHFRALLRDYAEAMDSLRLAYEELRLDPRNRWIAWYFDVCVIIAARLGQWEIAAQLLGYADRVRDENAIPRSQVMLPWLSEPKERMSKIFSAERFEALLGAGASLTLEGAQELGASMYAASENAAP